MYGNNLTILSSLYLIYNEISNSIFLAEEYSSLFSKIGIRYTEIICNIKSMLSNVEYSFP